ncbi:MAG: hypothetical protein JXB49_07980 [Bacteroidales bacterium]|nr:hypothetical protein [Bacteroidales bacterium]
MDKDISDQNDQKIIIRGRLNGTQRNRLSSLMNMMYSPSELADEIGFDRRQVYRVYVPLGCPYERDQHNRIWINGVTFRDWIKQIYQKKDLLPDEAFCIRCKLPIKMKNPVKKENNGLIYYLCECPFCGRRISRIITKSMM